MVSAIVRDLVDLWFPPRCAICEVARSSPCTGCVGRLEPADDLVPPDGVDDVLALLRYDERSRPLVAALKYRGRRDVAVDLAAPLARLLEGLESFRGVPGRMERVRLEGVEAAQPAVLVDYAHTPDGLESALNACRPFAAGRLICVFGCGGDRDRTKRPLMGGIAARFADQVVVTSDNPRTEDPRRILDDVVAGIPAGTVLQVEEDRAAAIAASIAAADADDLVLIAGKGHEDYQILGTTKVHFDDREEAERALRARGS